MSRVIEAQTARLLGPRQLVFETEVLDAGRLAEDEVMAETLVSVLSVGTEMAAYKGLPPLRPGPVYPRVVGYCNVARVVEVGQKVKGWAEGDVVLSHQSHRSAFVCGAADLLIKVPEGTDLGAAATSYLFHLGYSALLNAGFQVGQQVAVVGLGVLGLGAVACAALGGGRVAGFSGQAESLEKAGLFGAHNRCLKSDVAAVEGYLASTGQGGADLVIVTGDSWADWLLALKLVRRRGTLSVIGFPGRGQPIPEFNPLDPQYFYEKQVRILASGWSQDRNVTQEALWAVRRRNLGFLLDQIRSGGLPARELISSEHWGEELGEVYRGLDENRAGRMSCLLHWR